jgi:hypothetical protein
MDKAYSILIVIIVAGVLLTFLPRIGEVFGFGSSDRPDTGRLSTSRALISVSYDGGKKFEEGILIDGSSRVQINDFDILKKDGKTLFLAGSTKGLLLSDDEGREWYFFDDLKNYLTKADIVDLLANPLNGSEFFVATYKHSQGSVYKTTDGFVTLEKLFSDNERINKIDIIGNNLHLTMDDKREIEYNLSTRKLRRLNSTQDSLNTALIYDKFLSFYGEKRRSDVNVVYRDNLGRFFVGMDNKIYISGDYGLRWEAIDLLIGREVSVIKVFGGGKVVLVGTR